MVGRTRFLGVISAIARESARQRRTSEAERKRTIRQSQVEEKRIAHIKLETDRAVAKTQAQYEKEAKQRYLRNRQDEAETLNAQLAERLESLRGILQHTLAIDDTVNFESLRIQETTPPFEPPRHLREPNPRPILSDYTRSIKAPTGISSLIPGAKKRYQELLDSAKSEYHTQLSRWESDEKQRQADLIAAHKAYTESEARLKQKRDQRNAEVDEFRKAYEAGDPEAIVAYNNMVLERSDYPGDFPHEFMASVHARVKTSCGGVPATRRRSRSFGN